jgi:hypothetical protein
MALNARPQAFSNEQRNHMQAAEAFAEGQGTSTGIKKIIARQVPQSFILDYLSTDSFSDHSSDCQVAACFLKIHNEVLPTSESPLKRLVLAI